MCLAQTVFANKQGGSGGPRVPIMMAIAKSMIAKSNQGPRPVGNAAPAQNGLGGSSSVLGG